jgi:hypothetical protein
LVDPCFLHQSEGIHALTSAFMYCSFSTNVLSTYICTSYSFHSNSIHFLYSHIMYVYPATHQTSPLQSQFLSCSISEVQFSHLYT